MFTLAQVGLGSVGITVFHFTCVIWFVALFTPPLVLVIWCLPELIRLIGDKIWNGDALIEFERARELDGRLFDPEYNSLRKKV